MHSTEDMYKMIEQMNRHLRTELLKKDGKVQEEKLWENNFIRRQIEKRENGGSFGLKDHIRAMVYSLLSGGQAWENYARETDSGTGFIPRVDAIFHDYDGDILMECPPEQLYRELDEIHLGSRFGRVQLKALLTVNVPKLKELEEKGGIDSYYQPFIQAGIDGKFTNPFKILIHALSDSGKKDKMEQMGVALVCEYLRNVGYNLPKPDGHIRRVLGREILGFSAGREAGEDEAIQIMFEIADAAKKPVAEADYILWSYCSKGYGEVCTSASPKCSICVAARLCRKEGGYILARMKNEYVLESHYKIKAYDSVSEIIYKAAEKSFYTLCRRMFHETAVPEEEGKRLGSEVNALLADRIPELLESTDQDVFDERHHRICEDVVQICGRMWGRSYGIAQRWLNDAMINLIVIDGSLTSSKLPVGESRKYFHVPMGSETLEAAAAEKKGGYHYGLGIKCAQTRHEDSDVDKMDWGYEEYMEFQAAVRNALKTPVKKGVYRDAVEWGLYAAFSKH